MRNSKLLRQEFIVVASKGQQLLVTGARIFGDADCASVGLSRKHFRIYRTDAGFFLEDLGSTNGTFYQGLRLKPHVPQNILPGETFQAAMTEMRIERRGLSRLFLFKIDRWLHNDLIVFGIALSFVVLRPSNAFGLAIGFANFIFIACFMALASYFTRRLTKNLFSGDAPTIVRRLVHGAVTLPMLLIFSVISLAYGDKISNFSESLTKHKIEYFCVGRFQLRQCTFLVNRAPALAKSLPLATRDRIIASFNENKD